MSEYKRVKKLIQIWAKYAQGKKTKPLDTVLAGASREDLVHLLAFLSGYFADSAKKLANSR